MYNVDTKCLTYDVRRLEEEQEITDSSRTNSIVMTYYMAAGKKSGLLPIVVSLSDKENFQIPNRRSLMSGSQVARSCVVPVSHNGHRYFVILPSINTRSIFLRSVTR